jgi:RNA polymerase primary sigma factor
MGKQPQASTEVYNIYLREIRNFIPIGEEEETALVKRAKDGDMVAKQKLIRSNLRFVIHIARKYNYLDIELNDLINEGNMGLIKAFHSYNPEMGVRFITYAVHWIRQAIIQSVIEQQRMIRIPEKKYWLNKKIKQAGFQLEQKIQRKPTAYEVAEYMGIPEEKVAEIINIDHLVDHISEEDYQGCSDEVMHKSDINNAQLLSVEIEKVLTRFNDTEKKVLKMSFGIGYGTQISLKDIATELGYSVTYIRQIRERILNRLRRIENAQQLQRYLG